MTDTRSTPWLAIVIAMLLILPVLYVLSSGPMVLLYMHGYVSAGTITTIYWPLESASNISPHIENAVQWYLRAWGFEPPGGPPPMPAPP